MFTFDVASVLIGVILISAVAYAYMRIKPVVQRVFSRKYNVDLMIIEKLASCAERVELRLDAANDSVLSFVYDNKLYALQSNLAMAIEVSPDYWIQIVPRDAINAISAMKPRKQAKQENNNNNQSKNQDNNKQNGNNSNQSKQNVIPNDQAEKWYKEPKTWDEKPTKFTVNHPYFFCKSNVNDDTYGLWIVGKRLNGNKS